MTRIIIYAILLYALFLFLRFLVKLYISYTRSKHVDSDRKRKVRSRLDLDNIEDADFKEIKKQGDGEKN
jgi:hypothetical protein